MSPAKLALVLLIALFPVASQDADSKQGAPSELAKLSWLAGTWELRDGEKTTVEHWLPLAGNTLMGLSHTYDETTTHFFEFLRITVRNDTVAYVAQPGGSQPVPFLAVKLDEQQAVFENPKHDHPQRIHYARTEAGLTATISLLDGSRATSFVFRRRGK